MASKTETSPGEPVVIKKYANRRLYNTAKSCYVTLEDLATMVRDGEDFVVQDAKSKEDITRSVLAQIIFDEESKGQNMLPISFLRQLIGLYGDTLQGFVPSYLDASMETFVRNQEQMREQLSSTFAANPAMGNMETLARSNMEMFENAMKMFAPFGAGAMRGAEPKAPEPASEPASEKEDLDAMKEQLEAMQAQLSKLANSKK